MSDIHGNAAALQAVLAAAEREEVDELIVAGDVVGYYYEPAKVLRLLENWTWHFVRGNHEAMLGQWIEDEGRENILAKYGSAIGRAASDLENADIAMLLQAPDTLKLECDGVRIFVCHGSPWDPDLYVYPDADESVRARMARTDAKVTVFGHTHYPVIWTMGDCTVVNPGSVGQARDRKPGASWALFDTSTGDIQLRREGYDVEAVVAQCESYDPNIAYLREVLVRSDAIAR